MMALGVSIFIFAMKFNRPDRFVESRIRWQTLKPADELALRDDAGKMRASNRVLHLWFRKHKLHGSYSLSPLSGLHSFSNWEACHYFNPMRAETPKSPAK
jgi:hypothetical protein